MARASLLLLGVLCYLTALASSKPLFGRRQSTTGEGRSVNGTNGWSFVQNGTTGIIAIEIMVVSPTLALLFDRPANDPLMIGNHSAWGALWDFRTNTASPLDLNTNLFCASGSFLSNGTMVSVGGTGIQDGDISPDKDGLMGLRIFEPCTSPDGEGCTILDDPSVMHLAVERWYPSSLRIFDGSLIVIGGDHTNEFDNGHPENSLEFFPPKDGGVPRPSQFLADTVPINLFPRAVALPSGDIFILADNRTTIYSIATDTYTPLPDLPNGVRNSNPMDGTLTLLPLSPPDYVPEVLACGGSNKSDTSTPSSLSSQDPASDQCSRMMLTEEGIKRGWEVERMLEGRVMPEMILMPDGKVLIINGAGTGYSGYAGNGSVQDPIDESQADHPVFTPSLYDPAAPLGQRISNEGMPSTDIPRMYHSGVTLTPMGNVFIAGNNPNQLIRNDTRFHSEFRAEYLNPPFMSVPRPALLDVPSQVGFNERVNMSVTVPEGLNASAVKVALMDLGFSSHAFHSSSRLVFMESQLSEDEQSLQVLTPPNNRVYPPGPAYIFLTVDDVTSEGVQVMVGSGEAPPVADQGIPL